jgi:chitinase
MVTASPWDTPWSLVGPVGADEVPYMPTTLAPGTHPEWKPVPLYDTGDQVLFAGLPYEARWPNKGEAPSTLFPVGPDSAWRPLFTLPGEPPST